MPKTPSDTDREPRIDDDLLSFDEELDVAPPEPPYQPDEIYDALQQGDTLERLGGLRVLRIDGEVFVNGEKIDSPHRPALDALATHLTLRADHFGDRQRSGDLHRRYAGFF